MDSKKNIAIEAATKKKIVNVNILLNKVKIDEKKIKLEKVILLSIVVLLISITGFVTIL